jgi:hypothetical protein
MPPIRGTIQASPLVVVWMAKVRGERLSFWHSHCEARRASSSVMGLAKVKRLLCWFLIVSSGLVVFFVAYNYRVAGGLNRAIVIQYFLLSI